MQSLNHQHRLRPRKMLAPFPVVRQTHPTKFILAFPASHMVAPRRLLDRRFALGALLSRLLDLLLRRLLLIPLLRATLPVIVLGTRFPVVPGHQVGSTVPEVAGVAHEHGHEALVVDLARVALGRDAPAEVRVGGQEGEVEQLVVAVELATPHAALDIVEFHGRGAFQTGDVLEIVLVQLGFDPVADA